MPKVQLHREKVAQGIKVEVQEIAGAISQDRVTEKERKVEVKEKIS